MEKDGLDKSPDELIKQEGELQYFVKLAKKGLLFIKLSYDKNYCYFGTIIY